MVKKLRPRSGYPVQPVHVGCPLPLPQGLNPATFVTVTRFEHAITTLVRSYSESNFEQSPEPIRNTCSLLKAPKVSGLAALSEMGLGFYFGSESRTNAKY